MREKQLDIDIWHPKSGEIMCAIVAPTGIAAFNVGGLTIHRLFQLPIEHEGKTAGYWALNKEAQKRIKMTLKNYNSRQGIYGIQSKSSILTHALTRYIWN